MVEVAHEVVRVEFAVLRLHAHEIAPIENVHKVAQNVIHQTLDLLSHPRILVTSIIASIFSIGIISTATRYPEKVPVFILMTLLSIICPVSILLLVLLLSGPIDVNELGRGHRNPTDIYPVLAIDVR